MSKNQSMSGADSVVSRSMLAFALFLADLMLMAILNFAIPNTACAADGNPAGGAASAAPGTNGAPPAVTTKQAISSAREELRVLEERLTQEAREASEKIAGESNAVAALAQREQELRKEFERLIAAENTLDEKLAAQTAQRDQLKLHAQAGTSEITSQASDLRDRFKTALFGIENPGFLKRLEALIDNTSASPPERLLALLSLYDSVREGAATVGKFAAEVQHVDARGKVSKSEVLRLGLLAGFFTNRELGESGYITMSPDGSGQLLGHSAGLSSTEQGKIASFIASPAGGGTLTMDVSGGAGLASIQSHDTFARWFEKGGPFMWPLAVLFVICVVITIERTIFLLTSSMFATRHIRKVLSFVQSGRVSEAITYCDKAKGITSRVLKAALIHHDKDRAVVEDAVQEALLHNSPELHKRLSFIGLCSALGPLFGLLGTVTGMIVTFKSMTIFGTSDPRYMAGGISEALTATEGGLIVAIPAMLLRGVLGAMADGTLGKLEAGAMSVVLALLKRRQVLPGHDMPQVSYQPDDTKSMIVRSAAQGMLAGEAGARV